MTANFTTTITVASTPQRAFDAINDVSGWWGLAPVADKSEWTGTTVRFDIDETADGTRIVFTHEGLEPEDECYELCSNSWSMFVNGSLKAFIE